MYTSYYGMSCNPFLKEVKEQNKFESKDYKELMSRFNYLKEKMQNERDRLVCADNLDVIMNQTLSNTAVMEDTKRQLS